MSTVEALTFIFCLLDDQTISHYVKQDAWIDDPEGLILLKGHNKSKDIVAFSLGNVSL